MFTLQRFFLLGFLLLSITCWADKPALMLPKKYTANINISDYWISEKLDGVRARWDGKNLISRGGKHLHAPPWFSQDFPNTVLDGELWLARQRYADTWSIVSQQQAHDGWRQIKFMVFDAPEQQGTFSQRLTVLKKLAQENSSPYLNIIPQFRLTDATALENKLQQLVNQGAEGLILHHQDALYQSGRSDAILKLKPILFGQAKVIGYRAGKGRLKGRTGSLKVQTEQGQIFHVGSGLSDEQRTHPPPLNSLIQFKYQGHTKTGLPRFPVFIKVLPVTQPMR